MREQIMYSNKQVAIITVIIYFILACVLHAHINSVYGFLPAPLYIFGFEYISNKVFSDCTPDHETIRVTALASRVGCVFVVRYG